LGVGWARALLRDGTYTTLGKTADLSIGRWGNADNVRMSYNRSHNNHFHITLRAQLWRSTSGTGPNAGHRT